MKLALLLNVIAPSIGGVLIMGHRGTGKSTAVRALADLLPPITRVRGCPYSCDPQDYKNHCLNCRALIMAEKRLPRERSPVPVVDLPLGATEDRVCGAINIERAVTEGIKAFEPGLLAYANRGFLYIDEVNLLEDHLVDLLLDAAVTGRNKVEREGISTEHPARFTLVGSGNPEEGELRPQLLDRFGLYVEVRTADDLDQRVEIVERREAFERDPEQFCAGVEPEQASLRRRLSRAQRMVSTVDVPRSLVRLIAELCLRLKVDGHRGELTITRAARALAALEGRREASAADVQCVAAMSLRHRLRRDPLEQTTSSAHIDRALEDLFGANDIRRNDEPTTGRPMRNEDPPGDSAGGKSSGGGHAGNKPVLNDKSRAQNKRGEERPAPPVDSPLPEGLLTFKSHIEKPQVQSAKMTSARHQASFRASDHTNRGRYVRSQGVSIDGSPVALDATLRAAAPFQARRRMSEQKSTFLITASDLRFKRFSRKTGRLFILAIDTSGSMAVNRINQAKGALAHLLRHSYVNRDRIALVSFREREAKVLLPPSHAPARAKRILDALPIGGATPLAAGLWRALEVATRAAQQGAQQIVLLIFTDGRANVPLQMGESEDRVSLKKRISSELKQFGIALQRAGVVSVVVDTQNRFSSSGEGQALADALGGRCVHLHRATKD